MIVPNANNDIRKGKGLRFAGILSICLLLGGLLSGFISAGYSIQGNILAADGTVFILSYNYDGKERADSAVSSANQVVFKGKFPEVVICTLSNSANRQIRIFLAENSNMVLKGSVEKTFNIEIQNSAEHGFYEEFKEKSGKLSAEYRAALVRNGGDVHDKLNSAYLIFHARLDSLTTTFVKTHAGTTAAALAITTSYVTYPDRGKAQACYLLLSKGGKDSYYAKRVQQFIEAAKSIAPGKPAPDFRLRNLKGELVSLSDFKGKYVFLDFWASWCAPCRKEHPLLRKLNKDFEGKVQFISVSMDASPASWKQAVEADQLNWLQLNDPKSLTGELADIYGVKSLPFNCIIDPKGVIISTRLYGDALTAFLTQIKLQEQ